jgi:hypothetical protein
LKKDAQRFTDERNATQQCINGKQMGEAIQCISYKEQHAMQHK